MLNFILKRLFFGVVTIWLITTITFFLMHSLPGDPFASEKAIPPVVKETLMKNYHLDKPLIVQYGYYLTNILKGDLGTSMKIVNRKVVDMIASGFPYSLDVGLRATLFATIGGILLGIIAALYRGKALDSLTMLIAVAGVSIPSFVLAGLLQYVFGVWLHILPVARYESFFHTIMPTVALGTLPMASIARMTRASMIEVLGMDYIRTAKAKGLSPFSIVVKHGIRNAIMPVITYLGYLIAAIITGTFIIENIFAIPGLGWYYVTSIGNNDYTLVLGLTVFYSVLLVGTILIMDIFYGLVNPRIRTKGGK